MTVRGRNATVLVPGGAFVRLRLPISGARPGDTVPLPKWALDDGVRTRVRTAKLMAAAAATLVVSIMVTSLAMFFNPLPAVAMVSLDVNPSIGLWVNSLLRVVRVQALDEDAAALLEGLPPGRRPLQEYLEELVGRIAAGSAPAADRWLVVAATPLAAGGQLSQRVLSGIENAAAHCEGILRSDATGTVHSAAFVVPPEVAVAAREAGVSPGRYTLVLAAAAAGVKEIDTDHAHGGQLLASVKAAGVNPGSVISQVKSGDVRELWREHREQVTPKGQGQPGKPSVPPGQQGKPQSSGDPGDPLGQGPPTSPPGQGPPANPPGQGPPSTLPGQGPPVTPPGQDKKPGESGAPISGDEGAGEAGGTAELGDAGYSSLYPLIEDGKDEARGRASEALERVYQTLLRRFGPDSSRGPKEIRNQ